VLEDLPWYRAVRADAHMRADWLDERYGSATTASPFDYRGRVHRSHSVMLGVPKAA